MMKRQARVTDCSEAQKSGVGVSVYRGAQGEEEEAKKRRKATSSSVKALENPGKGREKETKGFRVSTGGGRSSPA